MSFFKSLLVELAAEMMKALNNSFFSSQLLKTKAKMPPKKEKKVQVKGDEGE